MVNNNKSRCKTTQVCKIERIYIIKELNRGSLFHLELVPSKMLSLNRVVFVHPKI